MIEGFGVDLADVARIQGALRQKGFESRVFGKPEIAYCRSAKGLRIYERFAARFAAKEAFVKACGGLFPGFRFRDVCVKNNRGGRPRLCCRVPRSGMSKAVFISRFHILPKVPWPLSSLKRILK